MWKRSRSPGALVDAGTIAPRDIHHIHMGENPQERGAHVEEALGLT
ncbi:MAG: hypothetical protein AAF968_07825 [Pseudomonadota bacterium]